MMWIIGLLEALAGPKLAKWFAGVVAALGGVLVLLAARHRGRAQGRAEMEAENARVRARKQAELGALRAEQADAATNRPSDAELDQVLDEGRF